MNSKTAALLATALLGACATAPSNFSDSSPLQPEGASGYTEKAGWAASKFVVAAPNPLATGAGYQVLKAGGSAIDAAIAVQMVLALVEPQASGIGGGAFLLYYNGRDVEAFDGRETAPAAADERLFLRADGKPLAYPEAVVGGRSVGVPGAVRMLEMAHKQYGKLPWARLFDSAIVLAETGFSVSPRLNTLLKEDAHLKKDSVAAEYFFKTDGEAREIGFLLRNPELGAILRSIATSGSKALHEGEIAQAIVTKVQSHRTNPGKMTLTDLARYEAKKRPPLCHDYEARGRDYRICGFPPPSSGAIAIGQILGILNSTQAAAIPLENGLPPASWLHLYTESGRLAFADRDLYLGDPDFVEPPGGSWMNLLDPAYLAERSKLIGEQSMRVSKPGQPGRVKSAYATSAEQPEYGTSHISIVDREGHAVAMTTTVEAAFGARQMVSVKGGVGGVLLNNELTDFSFTPADAQGRPIANRVEGGKRPRSSMAPTLVFDKGTGQLVMTGGGAGGAAIIHFTAKTLYGVLNWGLNTQQAINLPNFASFNGPTTVLEQGRFPPATLTALRARGAQVREEAMTSGLQAIQKTPTGFFGGADPRKEGFVMGD